MIELLRYATDNKEAIISMIASFYGFHANLLSKDQLGSKANIDEAEKTLHNWISSLNELYMITSDSKIVGFIHIGYRGGNVAWLDDIFIDEAYRNKGIGTQSIKLAEDIIMTNHNYDAVCIDVVPRNEAAILHYYKLGYDSLSMLTIRKELYENRRDKAVNILGLDFKV